MGDVTPVLRHGPRPVALFVRRLADGKTQRVPLPPTLMGPEGAQVGDPVTVYQTVGPERSREGVITHRPHLHTNRCTVRFAS